MIGAGQRGPTFERANVKCSVARSVQIELRPVRVLRLGRPCSEWSSAPR